MTETEFKQLKYAIALKMEELRSLQNQHLAETGQEYLAIGHRTDTDVTNRVRISSVADGDAIYLDKCVCVEAMGGGYMIMKCGSAPSAVPSCTSSRRFEFTK